MDNIATVLKGFVIAGAVVLVAGTVLLIVLIALRASDDAGDGAGTSQAGPLRLPVPAGARIEQVVPDGEHLILLGVDGAGRQFLAIVDPLTGERISLLQIRPE